MKKKKKSETIAPQIGRVIAEIMLLQRWAGGQAIDAARIFGLRHGFEETLRTERPSVISEKVQKKVEDLLDDVEAGRQSLNYTAIKDRLKRDDVDESVAAKVMHRCRLQGRFTEEVERIGKSTRRFSEGIESRWFGALHLVEVMQRVEGAKPIAFYAAAVPRKGEIIEPERGQFVKVAEVRYEAVSQTDSAGNQQRILVPHVYVDPVEVGSETPTPSDPHDDEREGRKADDAY